jgi:DNA modification methylase
MMAEILLGDCAQVLPTLEPASVQCCVTSPPYWGLRDYGTATWEGGNDGCDHVDKLNLKRDNPGGGLSLSLDTTRGTQTSTISSAIQFRESCRKCGARRIDQQLGLESTPEEYISNMVAVFRAVWQVLRDDGTLWLNLGDSYATSNPVGRRDDKYRFDLLDGSFTLNARKNSGLKPKDLCGIPWRVAFALQADGWYLRSDIIWHKPNPMPESVTDRPTKSHEYIFLLTKSERYFYDADAIREPTEAKWEESHYKYYRGKGKAVASTDPDRLDKGIAGERFGANGDFYGQHRNKRSVWTIPTQPYADAHFATFPEDLVKPCILAGSRLGDIVIDPFAGSGTTGKVAIELGRRAILIELNPAYVELAQARTFTTPGFL